MAAETEPLSFRLSRNRCFGWLRYWDREFPTTDQNETFVPTSNAVVLENSLRFALPRFI